MYENKDNKGDKTSFWKFLNDYRVEVPIIQRDYAQGRVGKEFLRTKFLEDLKGALDNESSPKETVQGDVGRKGKGELVLDFVYGSENIYVSEKGEKTKLIRPLDGQQRLTTLWLLHWYIALRAGELEGNCEVLERFTYETRISSREFCENLCIPKNFKSFKGEKIAEFIENQTWFSSAWKQDPTIQSMLRMLGGTETNDSIEKLFEKTDCVKYWDEIKGNLGSKRELKDSGVGRKARKLLLSLDGRQRTLALWLLFWYGAYKSKNLNAKASADDPHQKSDKVKDVLKELIPQTNTSKEFCEKLVSFEKEQPDGVDIVEHIKKQGWFSATWEQDPTIQTVLRLLGGTKSSDGIEDVFEGVKYKDFWEKLTSNKEPAPIVFYYLRLENFGLSDDLYVKMNARGKPLTPFENFKADLIGYLSKRAANDENWRPLYETIPAKLDNDWTDIFWDKRSNKDKKDKKDDEQKIDEIYFAFLERFFWNELFVAKTNNEYVLRFSKGSKLESPNSSFEYLDKDSVDEYLGIERYEFLDGEIPISVFENLEKVLDNYKKYKGKIPLLYGFKDFKFIPEYKEDGTVTKISNRAQRVIFFALCEYFKSFNENYDKEKEKYNTSLGRLIRVVCNLISGKDTYDNYYVREYSGVRDAIEYIDSLEVSKCPHDVYEHLANMEPTSGEGKKELSAIDRQWNEEIIKAEKILKDSDWEAKIIEAENYSFFEGAIRFLYQEEIVEMVGEEEVRKVKVDWKYFDKKWENAKNYFKGDVKGENTGGNYNSCLNNNDDQDEMKLLKALISKLDDKQFLAALFHSYRAFNNRPSSWRHYLLHPDLCAPIHELLLGHKDIKNPPVCDYVQEEESYKGPLPLSTIKDILYLLSQTTLLNYIAENIPGAWIRDGYHHNHCAIYRQKGGGVFLNAKGRDSFFKKNDTKIELFDEDIIIDKKIKGRYLLFGPNVYFDYFNDKEEKVGHFLWYEDDYIYLQEPDGKGDDTSLVKDADAPEESPEHWYCVATKYLEGEDLLDKSNDEILKSLDKLKNDYEEDMRKKEKANPPSNS